MNRSNRPIDYIHAQSSEIFHSQVVSEYCENRERQIELKIHSIPHTEILSLDRETMFTRLVNTYLSDESTDYPALDMDKVERWSGSNQTTVRALLRIPWTGDEGFFTFKPVNDYDPPSAEVTIHEVTIHWVKPTRKSPFTMSFLSMILKRASKNDSRHY